MFIGISFGFCYRLNYSFMFIIGFMEVWWVVDDE